MQNIQLNKAHKELKKSHTWTEQDLISFINTYEKELNMKRYEYRSHPVFRNREEILNSFYYNKHYTRFQSSTYKKLLSPESYFRDEFLLKNMDKESLDAVWADPNCLKGFSHSYYLFNAIIQNKDIEKLRELYKKSYSPVHITEGMRNSHFDVKVYQQSLALAVEFNDLELIKKVRKSERFFMWRDINEVTVEAFLDGSSGVSSKYPEIKEVIPQLRYTRKIYDKLATAGLSHLLNKHEILMFDMHSYIGRNFYCHHVHEGHLVDYTPFYKFVTGQIQADKLTLIGKRSTKFDKFYRDDVNSRYKEGVVGLKEALEKRDSKNMEMNFRKLVKFSSYTDVLHWISEPHTYFSALMLIHADKINPSFYNLYRSYVKRDSWYETLHERIVEVDNVEAFKGIKTKNPMMEYAKIAVIFKSHKILKHLKNQLSNEEKKELIALSQNLKAKGIIND